MELFLYTTYRRFHFLRNCFEKHNDALIMWCFQLFYLHRRHSDPDGTNIEIMSIKFHWEYLNPIPFYEKKTFKWNIHEQNLNF